MKRYLVFCYHNLEPSGGLDDIVLSLDDIRLLGKESCFVEKYLSNIYYDTIQVLDIHNCKYYRLCLPSNEETEVMKKFKSFITQIINETNFELVK